MKKACLVLEDGSMFHGESFGYHGQTFGEIIFTTSMTGYQEIITDPSSKGQIVVFTYPLIGNYGSILSDLSSATAHVNGLVVKEICHEYSNFRANHSLAEYLQKNEIVAISGIDTREIVSIIRSKGTMKGVISLEDLNKDQIFDKFKQKDCIDDNLTNDVSSKTIYKQGFGDIKIGIIDCGVKQSIIRNFVKRGCEVTVMPSISSYEDIIEQELDAILFSNGPGNPENLKQEIKLAKTLLGKMPVFGIGLGHQILALACGAKTRKMKIGHHGGNYPIKDLRNNRIYISSQNHGYVVDENSLKNSDLEISYINLTDNTIEGLTHNKFDLASVQFQPEATPGPRDAELVFDNFIDLIKRRFDKCQK